jgi:hypothetical protein
MIYNVSLPKKYLSLSLALNSLPGLVTLQVLAPPAAAHTHSVEAPQALRCHGERGPKEFPWLKWVKVYEFDKLSFLI